MQFPVDSIRNMYLLLENKHIKSFTAFLKDNFKILVNELVIQLEPLQVHRG